MSKDRFDGIKFTPKISVNVLGFGMFRSYYDKPATIIFKYVIDTERSEEFEFEM